MPIIGSITTAFRSVCLRLLCRFFPARKQQTGKSSDPLQIVVYLFLLQPQLFLIIHRLNLAAAAAAGQRTNVPLFCTQTARSPGLNGQNRTASSSSSLRPRSHRRSPRPSQTGVAVQPSDPLSVFSHIFYFKPNLSFSSQCFLVLSSLSFPLCLSRFLPPPLSAGKGSLFQAL